MPSGRPLITDVTQEDVAAALAGQSAATPRKQGAALEQALSRIAADQDWPELARARALVG